MTYKKTLIYSVISIILLIASIVLGVLVWQYRAVYLSDTTQAIVKLNDEYGTYGAANLYTLDENGNKHYFSWDYPNQSSGLKNNQTVLVVGEIEYIDTTIGEGSNTGLIIVGKTNAYIRLICFAIIFLLLLFFGITSIWMRLKKPWRPLEESQTKAKLNAMLRITMFWITVIAFLGTCYGIVSAGSIVLKKNHVTGTINYVTKHPHKSYGSHGPRYNQNVQVVLDEETDDGIFYSRTYFHTKGRALSKGNRVLVSYNDFNGNDGIVIDVFTLKFQAFCFIILLIEIIAGVVFFQIKKLKNRQIGGGG